MSGGEFPSRWDASPQGGAGWNSELPHAPFRGDEDRLHRSGINTSFLSVVNVFPSHRAPERNVMGNHSDVELGTAWGAAKVGRVHHWQLGAPAARRSPVCENARVSRHGSAAPDQEAAHRFRTCPRRGSHQDRLSTYQRIVASSPTSNDLVDGQPSASTFSVVTA